MQGFFILAINIALIAVAIVSGAFLLLVLLGVAFVGVAFLVIRQKLTGKPFMHFTHQRYTYAEQSQKPDEQGKVIEVEYQEVKEKP